MTAPDPRSLSAVDWAVDTVAEMKTLTAPIGSRIRTAGYFAAGDGGGASYIVSQIAPDEIAHHQIDNGFTAELDHDRRIKVEWFGAVEGGDRGAALQAAIHFAADLAAASLSDIEQVDLLKTSSFNTSVPIVIEKSGGGIANKLNINWIGTITAIAGTQWEKVNNFTGTGATTSFTLSSAPVGVDNVIVTVAGSLLRPTAYSVSGTTLTFNTAPANGAAIVATVWQPVLRIRDRRAEIAPGTIDGGNLAAGIQYHVCGNSQVIRPKTFHFKHFGQIANAKETGANSNLLIDNPTSYQWLQSDSQFSSDANFTATSLALRHIDMRVDGGEIGWAKYAVEAGEATSNLFIRGAHLFQGRPGGKPPRNEPCNMVSYGHTAVYLQGCDIDVGHIEDYTGGLSIQDCNWVYGGETYTANPNDVNDTSRAYAKEPRIRVYADGSNNPGNLQVSGTKLATIGFYSKDGNSWLGNYGASNAFMSADNPLAGVELVVIPGQDIVQPRADNARPLRRIFKPDGHIEEVFQIKSTYWHFTFDTDAFRVSNGSIQIGMGSGGAWRPEVNEAASLGSAGRRWNELLVKSINTDTLRATALPTSSAGLPAGSLWNDAGTVKVA